MSPAVAEKPRATDTTWLSPRAVLVLAYACLALGPPLTKWLASTGTNTPGTGTMATAGAISFAAFLFVGNLSAAGQVLAIAGPRTTFRDLWQASTKTRWLLMGSAIPAFVVPALMFLALQRTTVVNAVVLTRLGPLVYAVGGSLLLRRALSRAEAVSYSLTGAGVLLVAFVNGHFHLNLGDLLVIAATVIYSASAYGGRLAMAGCQTSTFVFMRNAVSALAFFAVAATLYGPEPFEQALDPQVWGSMAVYSLVALVGGQWSLYYAVSKVEPVTVANWSVLSPTLSILFAFLLVGETPTPVHFVAIALLAGGTLASQLVRRWEAHNAAPLGGVLARAA